MTPYQLLTPLISLIAVCYAWNLVWRRQKTVWEALLWTLFWGAIAYIAIQPASIDYLSRATGIQDRENAVLVTVLGVLIFLVFYLVIRLEALEQRVTKVVRKVSLRDAGLHKNSKSDGAGSG